MNDIACVTDKFHFTLYADDTTLVEPLCTFTIETNYDNNLLTSKAINKELKLITDWLCLNKLSLNAKKTKMMIFHHRQRNISNIKLKLFINKTKIQCVNEFDFLGTVFDECMTWHSHINKISSKISSVAGTLSRLKRFLPRDILKIIYNALIMPHLNFGILLWGHNVKRIYKLQKWAVRAITSSKYNSHTEPLFIKLKLLKVQAIYKLNILKFYYEYEKSLLPNYFNGMFDDIYSTHDHDTRQKDKPIPAMWKSLAAKHSIRYSLPLAIIYVPDNIVNKISTLSLASFSKNAKSIFINLYNPVCDIPNCYSCTLTA